MLKKYLYPLILLLVIALFVLAYWIKPEIEQQTVLTPPDSEVKNYAQKKRIDKPCKTDHPEWREAQTIDGVAIGESPLCNPDNPYDIAAFVKGINQVSMRTIMNTHLAEDALIKSDDLDGDGDPDIIRIKLEVIELNGASPDGEFVLPSYDIAPGIQPGLWVFAPKTRGMAIRKINTARAHYLLRAPSPSIRVEQGDKVIITLENSHYFPHTIHFHGVDHPWQTSTGGDNDGVPATGQKAVFPGDSRTYEMQPRQTGTMLYHCHVQTDKHFLMGLNGMFIVEENRPNNWLQTFNVGAGHVRHSSVAVKEQYQQEYDLHYQSVDKNLAQIIQQANDPRLIAQRMNRQYNMTESNENYFMLNGHSFPYTLRDAMIVVEENQNIKLRIANAQHTAMALHFHGHKATISHYDGIEAPTGGKITRDVFDIAPAQRLDIHLQTKNDGLHSYGAGVWIFHDHVETGVTSDGMSPGGNIAVLAYKSQMGEQGLPKIREGALDAYFDGAYYAKQKPVWAQGEFSDVLGDIALVKSDKLRTVIFGLAIGLIFGLLVYIVRNRKKEQ